MKKLLDILTFNLYNIRINKNKTEEKNMESPNYTSEMVEAMVALVLADHLLRQEGQCADY